MLNLYYTIHCCPLIVKKKEAKKDGFSIKIAISTKKIGFSIKQK
jgi:hypothetical protein